ncbi:hypothetical protein ETAA8_27530 [Anatilimnocola aggregata]|uniref:Uncharacterized protein n=1 Tax=Anatilimnocola aggregata TaxID=2528021 RepID=A0A517YBR6_9BACT|nr:hypothetical protein [Anatilimnocola aggregata]QDU27664.1 hypothetical protein ETAA8_27530 [Anatilimnocola aggregata]
MTDFARPSTIERYFSGLCEYIFQTRLGVVDPPLIDYLSEMLLRFVRTETMHRVRNLSGRPAVEVVDMLSEAENRIGLAKREVHRHIGDVTLFWTGVYPESLRELRSVEKKDFFIDYCSHGKKAYYIASTIKTDRTEDTPDQVLQQLSTRFEMCAFGLGEVRREWERRDDAEGRILLTE